MAKAARRSAEIIKLRRIHKKLYEALRSLFEILERYSPQWYDKRFHDQAKAALKQCRDTRQIHSKSDEMRRPVSGRDAVRSQVIDALEAQEIKETGNEEG